MRSRSWICYALLCIFWWGLWSFLAKIGSASATPLQLQVLFTFGMAPVAFLILLRIRMKLGMDVGGAVCGLLCGVLSGLGILGYYASMRGQDVSLVAPLAGLFPLITVLLSFAILRERMNRVQIGGMGLAVAAIVILSL
ncbi:MAG TPA: EamA family transporter [Terriglobales bacterium]